MSQDAGVPLDRTADIARVLYDAKTIQSRVQELAAAITADYLPCWQADPAWRLVLVSVLRGGIFFLTDLARALDLPVIIDFMAIAPFGGRSAHGKVRILKDLEDDVLDRDVLVVEDIIDTGLTLSYMLDVLRGRRPRSLQVASLLDRPGLRIVDQLPVAYTGFALGDLFVVGYGLDYRERYRELPFIGIPKEEIFQGTPPRR